MVTERIRRLLTILKHLESGRATPDSLAVSCGVSRRTIFRDIEAIRIAGIPLVFDEERQRYSLVQDTFLKPTHFTAEEALALITLAYEKGGNTSLQFFSSARTAALKLIGLFPLALQEYITNASETVQYRVSPRNPLNEANSIFDTVVNAQLKKEMLQIVYKSPAEPQEIELTLSPYIVFFSRRSWYVLGFSSLHQEIRMFNIGRMIEVHETGMTFYIPANFSINRYLRNAWHLIPEPGPDSHVVLRFSPKVAQNVAEVNWHKTQKIIHLENGGIDYSVTVSGVHEIAWWILGYGKEVEVISPPELKEIIRQHIMVLAKMYAIG